MATPKTKTIAAPKPKRGVGQAISRRRRLIADHQRHTDELRALDERNHARQLLEEQRNRHAEKDDPIIAHRINSARHAVNVLTGDHRAYMAAVGHANVNVNVTLTGSLSTGKSVFASTSETMAYTDFDNIVVKIPTPPLSKLLKEFVTELRGILHHEAGHVRFTKPFTNLYREASEANADLLFERAANIPAASLHKAWNALEDQRMEVAVVRATPRIANYFIPMVLNVVIATDNHDVGGVVSDHHKNVMTEIAPWLALAGRGYFDNDVRLLAKQRFDSVCAEFGVTSDEWFDIVSRYMSTSSPVEMMLAVIDAHRFIQKLSHQTSEPGGEPGRGSDVSEDDIYRKISNADEDHKSMDDKSGNADLDDSTSTPEQPEAPQDSADGEGFGEGEGDVEEDVDVDGVSKSAENSRGNSPVDQFKEQAEKAQRAVMESAEIDDVMSRINDRVGSGAIPTEGSEHSYPMADHHVEKAKVLAASIEDALETFRTEKSPIWVRRQEQGYLDVLEYRTREAGDTTYHVEPQNWDNNGLGIHVSFLADRSGSMHSDMLPLSQTLWAVKKACTNLGIPSTMVMWADRSETSRVMEHSDEPVVFNSRGGTYPITALDDIESHVVEDGLHHLVFVFTDGEWSAVSSLTNWKNENRTFVVIGLNCEKAISTKDADIVIPIKNIQELGFHVKSILTDHMASV
jgi:hypothetical protein